MARVVYRAVSMSDYLNHRLSGEDVDVILSALRLLQRVDAQDIPGEIREIGGASLDNVDTDDLCERLNFDGTENAKD